MQTLRPSSLYLSDRIQPAPIFAEAFVSAPLIRTERLTVSLESAYTQPGQMTTDPDKKRTLVRQLATATGLGTAALLLHKLPAHASSIAWLSSDWKDWARMALGIAAVDHVNKGFQWKPPPWLLGLQSVVALNLVSHGPLNSKGWRQLPLLAAFVPALVQITHQANQWVQQRLNQSDSKIPEWLPKMLVSVASTALGIVLLRRIIQTPAYQQFSGQGTASGTGQVMGAEAIVCSRCGGTHLICMSEISDMLGSLTAWFKGGPSNARSSKPEQTSV